VEPEGALHYDPVMDYVNLGRTGLKVSRICLGMMTYGDPAWRSWVLTEDEGRPFVQRALEGGINFFDTADMYSLGVSEEITGRALRDFARRDQVVIATKAYFPMGQGPNDRGLSRKHLLSAIDASLRRLGTDYVDLYQIHRWDPDTPIEETLSALHDIVRSGKARYIGASSMSAWQFAKSLYLADRHGWTRFVSMQNQYNLLYREEEREMVPYCRETGVGVVPWSPLARGVLARGTLERTTPRSQEDAMVDRYYSDPGDEAVLAVVRDVAAERGVPTAQVALAWLAGRPGVTAPIVGANRPGHLRDAVAALDLHLTPDEISRLEAPYRPHPVLDLAPLGAPAPAQETPR
jgi:1-deoxyxylulose-5-phosphate synthase